jgi:site-specific DNA recombinase
MQGDWNNKQAYYRCRFPQEYALANKINHPKVVYLREAEILEPIDAWLVTAFGPVRTEKIIEALAAQAPDPEQTAKIELTRKLSACDRKLDQYRAALDAGADPAEVTGWINAVKQERVRLEGDLRSAPRGQRLSHQEIADMIQRIGNLVEAATMADPDDKADLYRQLGLQMTYRPQKQLVEARLIPDPHMCKWFVSEGGLEPPCPVKGTSTSS